MKKYHTERLVLRTLEKDEHDLLVNYLERNKTFLAPWEPKREQSYFEAENIGRMLENECKNNELGTALSLYIFKKDSDEIIGNVTLSNIIYGPFLSGFIGYKLDHNLEKQGIMTEALNKMIEIAFNEYHLHRLEANIMPRNIASIKVVEKHHFEKIGLNRKYLKINGKWEDHWTYVLLNDVDEGL
ncbi:GNAT family N-acetyltransferase [Fusibacter ferrireducens]|uniref:GNAT family N-acetyltransferase n=1 Tax=Fusibacter ferrireducens TaxID=2785058 RepID=A0ABR9ZTX0_9FIRM|nr:GNAT family protein [Fusibacter ferrireducens]MBF4693922.1 GNAT family N-acetyltransferase [Fusibacter ferrireducens]